MDWLWPKRVAFGTLTLLAGDPGLGKSLLSLDVAARLSRGEGGCDVAPSLLVTAEDSLAATVTPRLKAAGADRERVKLVQVRAGGLDANLILPDDVPKLGELVRATEARLLVIDPLAAHLSRSTNSWHDQSVRIALAPLQGLAEETGAAVLVVAHLNKGQDAEPLRRIGGSVGIAAAVRSILLLARDPDDPEGEQGRRRVLAHVKSNLAPLAPSLLYEVESVALGERDEIETARLRVLGKSRYSGSELLAAGPAGGTTRIADAIEFLERHLAAGPRPAEEIEVAAIAEGIAETTLKRAKKERGVESRRVEFGGPWFWALPEELKADDVRVPAPDGAASPVNGATGSSSHE